MEILTNSPSQTQKAGEVLAKEILRRPNNDKAFILGLEGDLGGGKTTFLQGFAKGLGIKEKILSPTFVIMKRFKIKYLRLKFKNFYHIDCYRIKSPKELLNLGFQKIISNPQNIVAVEWSEKIRQITPLDALWIRFEFLGRNKRKIVIKSR